MPESGGSSLLRRWTLSASLIIASAFAGDTASAAPASRDDVAQSLRKFTQPIQYEPTDIKIKKLVDSYHAGALYAGIRIETTGVDPASVGQFSCASTSFWHFVTKLFGVTKNQSFTLEAAFSIGGYPIPSVPILVLSDVEGNCKYVVTESKRLIPLTKINANTNVEVTFVLRRTNSRDFKLIDNFRPVVSAVAAAFGSTHLVSELAQPVLINASKSVSDLISSSSLTDVSGQVTTSFDLLSAKGLDFAPQGEGAALHIRMIVDPQLSIYTSDTKGEGKNIVPLYPDVLNVYSESGVYSIDKNNSFVSMSVKEHFQQDTTARALLARLVASPVDSFTSSCDEIRAELQDRLRLAEGDLLKNYFYILQRTHWYDDDKFKRTLCVSSGDSDGMKLLGLPVGSGDLSRADSLDLMNRFLDEFGKTLHYGTTESKKRFFGTVLAAGIDADDPAELLLASSRGKESVVSGLSQARVSAFACYSTSVDQPPVVRTALVVTADGKNRMAFSVEVTKFGSDSKVSDLSAVSIAVTPMDPKDPEASVVVARVLAGRPGDKCVAVLRKYFSDFPGVSQ